MSHDPTASSTDHACGGEGRADAAGPMGYAGTVAPGGPHAGPPPYHDPWHLGPHGMPFGAPPAAPHGMPHPMPHGAPTGAPGYGPAAPAPHGPPPGYGTPQGYGAPQGYGPAPYGAAAPYGPMMAPHGPMAAPGMPWDGRYGQQQPWTGGPHGNGADAQGAPGASANPFGPGFSWTSGWLDFRNEAYLKGMLVGALGAVLLSNGEVQKKAMQSVAGLWSLLQGGVEEIKERFADVEAEMQAAQRHTGNGETGEGTQGNGGNS